MIRLLALLGLTTEDRHKVKLMAPIFFFAGISELLTYSSFMALFNLRFGVDKLPYIYLIEAVILPIEGWIMALISSRVSKPRFMQFTYFGLIAILLLNGIVLITGKMLGLEMYFYYPIMFIASSFVIRQQSILLWSTAFDLSPTQQAKRLVPTFVALALVGGFVAGFVVQWVGPVFGNEMLYLLSPLLLIVVIWNFRTSIQRFLVPLALRPEKQQETAPATFSNSYFLKETFRSPFLLVAIALMTFMPALYFLIEYQYFTSAHTFFDTEEKFISYNGLIVVLIFTAALIFQLVSGRLMKWLGASNFLLAVSFIFLGGYILNAILINSEYSLIGVSIGYSVFYMLLYYFSEPCFQLFFKMMPLSTRDGFRFIAQSIAASGGIIVGACMQLFHSSGLMSFQTQAICGMVGGIVLVLLAWFGKVLYMNKLIENIQDLSTGVQEIASEVLGSIRGSKALASMTKFLQHPNDVVREITMDIIGMAQDPGFNTQLLEAAEDPKLRIRLASIKALSAREMDIMTMFGLVPLLSDEEPEVRRAALNKLAESKHMQLEIYSTIRPALQDPHPRVKAAAIQAVYQLDCEKDLAECETAMEQLLDAQGESVVLACEIVYARKLHSYSDAMIRLADSSVPSYKVAAIRSLGKLGRTDSIPKLMELVPLADKELSKAIIEAFIAMGEPAVLLLRSNLNSLDPVQWQTALIAMSRMGSEQLVKTTLVESCTERLQGLLVGYDQLRAFDRQSEPDLYRLAVQRVGELSAMFCEAAWSVLLRLADERVIDSLRNSIADEDHEVRENAYEALAEGFGDRQLAIALLDVLKKAEESSEEPETDREADIHLTAGVFGSDHWLAEIASYRRHSREEAELQSEPKLLSLIDKIIFLKQVPLFENLSLEELGLIANIATEEMYLDSEFLMRMGEVNMTMFVIIEGNVELSVVSSAGWEGTIGVLGAKESFGESVIFDHIPSTFTAQALLDDVRVLTLKGEQLERLVRLYPEIGIGFLRASSARVRRLESMITKLG
ncbi:HEAT repeat domain-containing protein [Paenibacillus koleovorans]|uniref:HEAT repeat domain-containing protein n=1 Tax=Paenibacillus koleovorans TaxID=121608 RepID=UPI000FD9647E|nr:HEAT repeat domain-containing protein [Paenibacillus koleovorans]